MTKQAWLPDERVVLEALSSPESIQSFLDELPYSPDATYRSPRQVMRERVANCMEGALFAAAALEHIGHAPVIVDLLAERDDDHVLAMFRENGRLGCIAKSNFSGLRWRSPVYRSLRELALSYFDHYYNVARELTMRGWTRPLRLDGRRFTDWRTRETNLDDISDHLDLLPRTLLFPGGVPSLRLVDDRLYTSGLAGAEARGLYVPGDRG